MDTAFVKEKLELGASVALTGGHLPDGMTWGCLTANQCVDILNAAEKYGCNYSHVIESAAARLYAIDMPFDDWEKLYYSYRNSQKSKEIILRQMKKKARSNSERRVIIGRCHDNELKAEILEDMEKSVKDPENKAGKFDDIVALYETVPETVKNPMRTELLLRLMEEACSLEDADRVIEIALRDAPELVERARALLRGMVNG